VEIDSVKQTMEAALAWPGVDHARADSQTNRGAGLRLRLEEVNRELWLVLSLFVLAPSDGPQTTGYEVAGIGLTGLGLMARPSLDGIRNRRSRSLTLRVLVVRFGLSALADLGLIAAGAALLLTTDYVDAFHGLLLVVVLLLVVAVRNTWDLLVTVADKTARYARSRTVVTVPLKVTCWGPETPGSASP